MVTIKQGNVFDVAPTLDPGSINTIVTSPPYWGLRDYGHADQIGLEATTEEFVGKLVSVFEALRPALRDDGTLWVNLGDSYTGSGRGADTGSTLGGSRENQQKSRDAKHFQANAIAAGAIGRRWDPPPSGLKLKNLVGTPWRFAFAMQAAGWYLRQDIIWHKPNPMPESVTDRCTKAHEYIFLFAKQEDYYFDSEAIAEPAIWSPAEGAGPLDVVVQGKENVRQRESKKRGEFAGKTNAIEGREAFRAIRETRNKRSVWTVSSEPLKEAHFAPFPRKLIRPCILAGCPVGGTVLDPFGGSGTTGEVSEEEGRNSILIELNPEYVEIAQRRTQQRGLFAS